MSNSRVALIRRLVSRSTNNFSVIGLVWGFLQASTIIGSGAFGYLLGHNNVDLASSFGIIQSPVDQFLVFLIFIFSLLSGYALRDPEKSIKALLISQLTAVFPIISLLYLSSSIFPSVAASVYAAGLVILSFILGMIGCLVGAISGEFLFSLRRTYRFSLNNYTLVLVAILLLVMALGSVVFVGDLNR
jgi:hypothetical protein